MLREGNSIYIAGFGDLKKDPSIPVWELNFPQKGIFPSNGSTLQFLAIANENGLCYNAYYGFDQNPCPPEPFPFWNKKPKP